MKICMVTPMYPPEQSAIALLPKLIGNALESSGHDVHYITLMPRQTKETTKSLNVIYVRPFFRESSHKNSTLNLLKTIYHAFVKTLQAIKSCDVVHIHSYTPLYYSSFLLSKLFRKPCLITLYGEILDYPPGSVRPLSFFSVTLNHFVDHVVFYSNGLKRYAKTINITNAFNSVIYPPLDDMYFETGRDALFKKPAWITASRVLLSVKGLYELAGTRYLLEAMPFICKDCPDTQLIICGDGPLRRDLEALCEKLEIKDKVNFLGWVPNTELVKYYHAADVFVLPSLAESFSHVIVEALSCSTPVVATETMGSSELKEIFPDCITLVPSKDSHSLYKSICGLLNEPKKQLPISIVALLKNFQAEYAAMQYLKLYLRLQNQTRD